MVVAMCVCCSGSLVLKMAVALCVCCSGSLLLKMGVAMCVCVCCSGSLVLKMAVAVCVLQWFEDKQQQIEALDQQLHKLHNSVETLVAHRRGECSAHC